MRPAPWQQGRAIGTKKVLLRDNKGDSGEDSGERYGSLRQSLVKWAKTKRAKIRPIVRISGIGNACVTIVLNNC